MTKDIDVIIQRMREAHPEVRVEQLQVRHPADDDGIWFFSHSQSPFEVQLESSFGVCPFLIETREHDERIYVQTVEEAVIVLGRWLHLTP